MILNDEVGPFGNAQRQTFRKETWLTPDRPAAQMDGRIARTHPAETRLRPLFPLVRVTGWVGEVKNVMHHGASGRPHVNGRHPLVFSKSGRYGNIAINIGAVCRDMIGGR